MKRVLAENVIALIILPKRSVNDTPAGATELAPNFSYDSRLYQTKPGDSLAMLTRNQLPPLVQVTMVAIDEKSAARLESRAASASAPPDLGLGELFKTSGDGTQLTKDLATLEDTLNDTAQRDLPHLFHQREHPSGKMERELIRRKSSAVALVIVLGMLVLLSVVVIASLTSTKNDLTASRRVSAGRN